MGLSSRVLKPLWFKSGRKGCSIIGVRGREILSSFWVVEPYIGSIENRFTNSKINKHSGKNINLLLFIELTSPFGCAGIYAHEVSL